MRAAAEDTDLGFRAEAAGLRVVFEPTALVFHDVAVAGVLDAVRDRARSLIPGSLWSQGTPPTNPLAISVPPLAEVSHRSRPTCS